MLIGVGFRAGAGKDTVASWLIRERGFVKLAFATPLKEAISCLFGWPKESLEDQSFKERIDPLWGMSPRTAMQRTGTDFFRNQVDPDFWVKNLLRRVLQLQVKQP